MGRRGRGGKGRERWEGEGEVGRGGRGGKGRESLEERRGGKERRKRKMHKTIHI